MAFKDTSDTAKKQLDEATKKWVKASSMLVERDAVLRAPVGDTGDLKKSIRHLIQNKGYLGLIGAQAEHGIFVEKGTGEFASEGGGRHGYWVYIKGRPSGPGGKTHTLQSAIQAVRYLRSIGLDAYLTNGMKPRPFLMPAFRDNKSNINRLAKKYYAEVGK